MKESGWALVSLGVLLLLGALLVDVSVDVGYIPTSPYLPSLPREVANLHAMHIQALIVQGGFASIICGMIAIGFGTVAEAIREGRQADSADSAPPSAVELSELPASVEPEVVEVQPDNMDKWMVGVGLGAALLIALLWLVASLGSENGSASANGSQEALDAMNAAANELDNVAAELDNASGGIR